MMTATLACVLLISSRQVSNRQTLVVCGRNFSPANIDAALDEVKDDHIPEGAPYLAKNYCLVFFNIPSHYVVYDSSYEPLRALHARDNILNLFANRGLHPVATFSKMPIPLWDEVTDLVNQKYPGYEIPSSTLVTFSVETKTVLKLSKKDITLREERCEISPTAQEKEQLEAMKDYRMYWKSDVAQYESGRDSVLSRKPTSNIYVSDLDSHLLDFGLIDTALNFFGDWQAKQQDDQNRRIYSEIKRLGGWKETRPFIGSDEVRLFAVENADAMHEIERDFLSDPQKLGYRDIDAMRSDAFGSRIESFVTFKVSFYLSDSKQGFVELP